MSTIGRTWPVFTNVDECSAMSLSFESLFFISKGIDVRASFCIRFGEDETVLRLVNNILELELATLNAVRSLGYGCSMLRDEVLSDSSDVVVVA